MRMYTVVLLYPDYMTDDYGADVYVESTEAEDFNDAVRVVQEIVAFDTREAGTVRDPADFRPVLVMKGQVEVVADARSF